MKKPGAIFYHIIIFVVAQLTWFSLLGLWIYWYINNYLFLNKVGDKLSPQIISGSTNIFALVSGLVLLVMLSLSMSLIFIYLNRQMNITRLYDQCNPRAQIAPFVTSVILGNHEKKRTSIR